MWVTVSVGLRGVVSINDPGAYAPPTAADWFIDVRGGYSGGIRRGSCRVAVKWAGATGTLRAGGVCGPSGTMEGVYSYSVPARVRYVS